MTDQREHRNPMHDDERERRASSGRSDSSGHERDASMQADGSGRQSMSDTGSLGEANASGAMGASAPAEEGRARGSRETPGNSYADRSTTSDVGRNAGRTQDDEMRAASEDYAGHSRSGSSPAGEPGGTGGQSGSRSSGRSSSRRGSGRGRGDRGSGRER